MIRKNIGGIQAWNDPVFDVWLVRIKNIQYQIAHEKNAIFPNVFQTIEIDCMETPHS